MAEPQITRVERSLHAAGVNRIESTLSAVALLTAHSTEPDFQEARELFYQFSKRIAPAREYDGLNAAKVWMEDSGFSNTHWAALDEALLQLIDGQSGVSADWTTELAAALKGDGRGPLDFSLSMPIATALAAMLDLPPSESSGCIFPSAATIAWCLSGDREVTFFAGDHHIAIVTALIAHAAGRSLNVDRRNPFDGSLRPGIVVDDHSSGNFDLGDFDHLISIPPFGLRVREGSAKGIPFEAFQTERLASQANMSFSTIVPDGFLFRENKHESILRRKLIEKHETTVMSLPPGMFLPGSGVSTSLLIFAQIGQGGVARLVDGRTMSSPTTGKVQERMIVRQLEQFRRPAFMDSNRTTIAGSAELAASNYSLLPERYLHSASLTRMEAALKDRQKVILGDVAAVERSKAPAHIRDERTDAPLRAKEIAPADIVDGTVETPHRSLFFEEDQRGPLANVAVESGDILVSIKGNVGIVGIVGVEADAARIAKEPWIVSQSLAIVRLYDPVHFSSPHLLNAFLTAPWVREKLESMSGGSTVRTLPISALRGLIVPVPSADESAQAQQALDRIDMLREKIAEILQDKASQQDALWHQLWHIDPEIGED